MTLTKRSLRKLGESLFILFTKEQENIILERFSKEPMPYAVWSEQDIIEQIRKILIDYPAPEKPLPDFLK